MKIRNLGQNKYPWIAFEIQKLVEGNMIAAHSEADVARRKAEFANKPSQQTMGAKIEDST